MVSVAVAFAVIRAGGGATQLGVVLAARSLALVVSLVGGGVLADRMSRKRLLIGADIWRTVTQGILALTVLDGHVSVVRMAGLSALSAIGTGVFNPAATGFLPSVVSREQLQRANSLRGIASSGSRVVGPLVAGLLVTAASPGWALLADALSYATSAALMIRVVAGASVPRSGGRRHVLVDLREGWGAFASRKWLLAVVSWISLANFLIGSWSVLGPIAAVRYADGAKGWSLIMAAQGVGGVVGGVWTFVARPKRPVLLVVVALALFFVPLPLLALGAPLPLIMLGGFVGDAGLIVGFSLFESVIQTRVPADVLSRVSAYNWLAATAFTPIGLAVWAALGGVIGARVALSSAFVVALLAAALVIGVDDVRRTTESEEQLANA